PCRRPRYRGRLRVRGALAIRSRPDRRRRCRGTRKPRKAQVLDEEAGVLVPTGVPTPRPERPVGHRLADVAAFLRVPAPTAVRDVTVTGLAQDSRQVRPGDVYLARPGAHTHGAEYAGQAAKAGAAAAVTDEAGRGRCEAAGLPTLGVDDPTAVLGRLSAWVYGEPARAMRLLGVTGMNGKTTT